MAEKRWRANLLGNTVDEIVIVHETDQFVDVQSPPRGAWAATVRREAKVTSYSKICKSKKDAWTSIAIYASLELEKAEASVKRLKAVKANAESGVAQSTD